MSIIGLNERVFVDRHQCHMADKSGVFVDEDTGYVTGYLNVIKDPISHVLLLILAHELLLNCL